MDASQPSEDLLVPVVRGGEVVYDPPALQDIQARAREQLGLFHPTTRRLDNPHEYPVGLEARLCELKNRLILEARAGASGGASGGASAECGVRNAE